MVKHRLLVARWINVKVGPHAANDVVQMGWDEKRLGGISVALRVSYDCQGGLFSRNGGLLLRVYVCGMMMMDGQTIADGVGCWWITDSVRWE